MASNQRLLSFFPTIREGESIYSICARFHQLSGYLRPEVTSKLLLGHCHGGTRQDMQVGLAHLLQVSGGAFESIPEMLRTRTVLRAYLPLMSSLRRAAILRTCSQPWSVDTTRATAGLTWNKVTTYHELRICTECAERQRREFGSCYWLNSHQLPGVWVCLEHGGSLSVVPRRGRKIREWISAENAWSTLNHGSINPVSLNRFRQLAACVNWIGSNESLTFEVLAAMIRSRLKLAGFARSDVKMTTAELERLNSAEILPLVSSGAPHFAALGNPVWISPSLKDRRTAHPVKLAALLAIAGECTSASLTNEYFQALARLPENDLFDTRKFPLRTKAPERLYDAIEHATTIQQAASLAKMRVAEVSHWLAQDDDLGERWKSAAVNIRTHAAEFTLRGAIAANPDATRMFIVNRCLWAARWLEQKNPKLLDQILPRSRQRSLHFQFALDF